MRSNEIVEIVLTIEPGIRRELKSEKKGNLVNNIEARDLRDNQLVSRTISIQPTSLIILIILAVMGWENVFSPARLFHYQFA